MIANKISQIELEQRIVARVMDAFVRIGLVLVLAFFCYRALAPFLTLLIWGLILAVTLYPLHDVVARKMGGRHGLAATLIVMLGLALIVAPSAVLMSSLGDSVHQFARNVQSNSLQVPAPSESVATWPFVGPKLYAMWSQAHADLPALVKSMQPKIGDIAKSVLAFVASIGGGLLLFLAALIIAGILMAFGESGSRASVAIFRTRGRPSTRRGVRHAVHGDHPRRRAGRHRRRVHSGDHRRPVPAGRRRPLGRASWR